MSLNTERLHSLATPVQHPLHGLPVPKRFKSALLPPPSSTQMVQLDDDTDDSDDDIIITGYRDLSQSSSAQMQQQQQQQQRPAVSQSFNKRAAKAISPSPGVNVTGIHNLNNTSVIQNAFPARNNTDINHNHNHNDDDDDDDDVVIVGSSPSKNVPFRNTANLSRSSVHPLQPQPFNVPPPGLFGNQNSNGQNYWNGQVTGNAQYDIVNVTPGSVVARDTMRLRNVKLGGENFKSEQQVYDKEAKLKAEVKNYRELLSKRTEESRNITAQIQQLSIVKERLKKLGYGADSNSIQKHMIDLNSLSERSRRNHIMIKELTRKEAEIIRQFKQFTNVLKPQILKVLRESPILVEKAPGAPSSGVFEGTNSLFQPHINVSDDDYNDVDLIREARFQPNIYTEKPNDLRHLLESIKTIEEEAEGESLTPEDLTVNLLKHQRLGLRWLERTEDDTKKRGGILADDMGLGKTIQSISLMLSHRSKNEDCKTNLIICPVALIKQWETEIQTKIKESANLSVFIFHSLSGKRITTFKQLAKYDVVLTSYNTITAELKKHTGMRKINYIPNLKKIQQLKTPGQYNSPFFDQDSEFYRIILDEAQWIKNKNSAMSMACSLLDSKYRWCLSGTPMQNRLDELFPLIRFLKIKPYCYEANFRADIKLPMNAKNENYDETDVKNAFKKIQVLLKAIMLRRAKDSQIDGKPLLELPAKSIHVTDVRLDTDKNEQLFYRTLESNSKDKVRTLLGKSARGNYSSILTLLLRLRQACLHSELVKIGERRQGISYEDEADDERPVSLEKSFELCSKFKPEVIARINTQESNDDADGELENRFNCPICLDTPPDENWTIFYPCGHGLCKECIESFFEKFQENIGDNGSLVAKCTQCRLPVKKNELVSYEIFDKVCNKNLDITDLRNELIKAEQKTDELAEKVGSSASNIPLSPKFKVALDLIKDILKKDPDEKIILFSQFTTLFKIFSPFLIEEQIGYSTYEGSMNSIERNETIKNFYSDPSIKVILISLKAGNVGLTLTCANHVILMDPFWNPYVEEQAQDRAHRIGQTKPVQIYRILTKDTVEDRIMDLQKKKKELIEGAMGEQGMRSVSGLGRHEIGYLFGLNGL